MNSASIENYLKTIFILQEEDGNVSTRALSEKLSISPPSVSEMIKKLARNGHIHHTPYRDIKLTAKGRKRALQIVRRHRLWESFLYNILKYDIDEVHQEAEQLEHIASDKLEKRIDKILGSPRIDPHGDAIPSVNGGISCVKYKALSQCKRGDVVSIARIRDTGDGSLKYAAELNITLQQKLKIIERVDFDDSIKVKTNKTIFIITKKLANNIFIEHVRSK